MLHSLRFARHSNYKALACLRPSSRNTYIMSPQLPVLKDVEKLSDRVIRILGQNPGKFTLQGTNTYLVGSGAKRILIDTGEGKPEWIDQLRKTLESEKASIDKVLITHWHHDHVGGVKNVQAIDSAILVYKQDPSNDWKEISDGERFEVEGATLRALHTPGHTSDHMSFVLEEEDALFTGDNVLGHGTAVFEDLATYMETLNSLVDVTSGRGYPGHGVVLDSARAKIQEYIKHRAQREREVLEVLTQASEGNGLEIMDMVKVIYKDTPESLHLAAARGVMQVLDKLQDEGKVRRDEDNDTWLLKSKSVL